MRACGALTRCGVGVECQGCRKGGGDGGGSSCRDLDSSGGVRKGWSPWWWWPLHWWSFLLALVLLALVLLALVLLALIQSAKLLGTTPIIIAFVVALAVALFVVALAIALFIALFIAAFVLILFAAAAIVLLAAAAARLPLAAARLPYHPPQLLLLLPCARVHSRVCWGRPAGAGGRGAPAVRNR